jgi:hypothetical protein
VRVDRPEVRVTDRGVAERLLARTPRDRPCVDAAARLLEVRVGDDPGRRPPVVRAIGAIEDPLGADQLPAVAVTACSTRATAQSSEPTKNEHRDMLVCAGLPLVD